MQTAFDTSSHSYVGTVLKDRMLSDRANRNLEALASSFKAPSKLREIMTKPTPTQRPVV